MSIYIRFVAFVCFVSLTACGGGGSSGSKNSVPAASSSSVSSSSSLSSSSVVSSSSSSSETSIPAEILPDDFPTGTADVLPELHITTVNSAPIVIKENYIDGSFTISVVGVTNCDGNLTFWLR